MPKAKMNVRKKSDFFKSNEGSGWRRIALIDRLQKKLEQRLVDKEE